MNNTNILLIYIAMAFGIAFELYTIALLARAILLKKKSSGMQLAAGIYFAISLFVSFCNGVISFGIFILLLVLLILTRMWYGYIFRTRIGPN